MSALRSWELRKQSEVKLGFTLQFLYCLASLCGGKSRKTGLFMRACQDHGIWHVEHLAKLWEALSSFSILTYSSAGLVEGASSRQVPSVCPSCSGCSWAWQAVGKGRMMACWEWSGQWTFMATFNLSDTEHIFVAVCDLGLDYINRCTWPFKLQVATQLAHEDLHDLFRPVWLSSALSMVPCLAKKCENYWLLATLAILVYPWCIREQWLLFSCQATRRYSLLINIYSL